MVDFLETDLFNSGVRPAMNAGVSVSRVGGAAQTKIVKKLGGGIRLAPLSTVNWQPPACFRPDDSTVSSWNMVRPLPS